MLFYTSKCTRGSVRLYIVLLPAFPLGDSFCTSTMRAPLLRVMQEFILYAVRERETTVCTRTGLKMLGIARVLPYHVHIHIWYCTTSSPRTA
jgi:hypothetical protein